MDISINYIAQILKTLPIGYYAKRQLRLKMSDTAECSFYSPSEDSITISYQQLLPVLQKFTDDTNIENKVRCMLYHEVSHAILTPERLEMTDEVNIVEDERIETIFKNFYIGVDFKQFVKEVNDYKPGMAITARQAFYALVRFREGTQEWLGRLNALLREFVDIDRRAEDTKCYSYKQSITDFANDFYKWYAQKQTRVFDDEITTVNDTTLESTTIDTFDDKAYEVYQHVQELRDGAITDAFARIINCINKTDKNNGSAITAYSGVFDARLVERDDYKYFVQKNRIGNIKKFAKVHFNLFIDRSYSFKDSESFVNKLIYSLGELERRNPNFTFTLITCGDGQTICDKAHRELTCDDGTLLSEEIYQQFKQVQVAQASNFNIVLYDGDIFACDYYGRTSMTEKKKRLGVFDTKNTLFITDYDNEKYLSKFKQAKYIICKNYANELYKQLLVNLEKLLR